MPVTGGDAFKVFGMFTQPFGVYKFEVKFILSKNTLCLKQRNIHRLSYYFEKVENLSAEFFFSRLATGFECFSACVKAENFSCNICLSFVIILNHVISLHLTLIFNITNII